MAQPIVASAGSLAQQTCTVRQMQMIATEDDAAMARGSVATSSFIPSCEIVSKKETVRAPRVREGLSADRKAHAFPGPLWAPRC